MTYTEAFVQTSYGSIYTKHFGNVSAGNVLVFLHDALGSVSIWGSFPDKIYALTGLPVLVFDRLGYGKSDEDVKPREVHYLEYEAQVRLPELLRLLNIQNPVIVGHSDGGTIALVYAAKFAAKAIVCMAPHIYEEEKTRAGIRAFFHHSDFPLLLERLKKHHGPKTHKVLCSWRDTWLSEGFVKWNISHFLEDVSCPCLFIQGKEDEYGTDQQILDIERLLGRKSQVEFLSDCGHVPYKEQQERVLKLMSDYFLHLNFAIDAQLT
jgi:pimeloyl-ACP methyl ester carboxylesterase